MARRGYRVQDDSVTVKNSPARLAGKSVGNRGEDLRRVKAEPGVKDVGSSGGGQRAAGVITARYYTGVDPQNMIDDRMPNIEIP